MDEKHISIKELADLKGVSPRAVRLAKLKYQTREVKVKGGKSFEILFSSIEPELQDKYLNKIAPTPTQKLLPVPIDFHKPDKAKEIALARFNLLKLWQEQRKHQKCKTKFDTDFLGAYNANVLYAEIFHKLGTVSIGTLQRWKRILGQSHNYDLLLPSYHYEDFSRTTLTDFEKQIFLKLLLHPNKFSVGKAISLTQYVLKTQKQEYIPSVGTFRRFANWYRDNNYDKWILFREGEKALKDEVIPHIKRDISKIEVGEVLVADGKRLNFQVINPFTGKPTRATLIGFLDWKSGALVGYEIMLEENTQCVAAALRNSILNLGKLPKFLYLDNGRAFKNKFFTTNKARFSSRSLTGAASLNFKAKQSEAVEIGVPANGDKNLEELGFVGIYQKLDITPIFANPYNARAKVIERFFLEMQESFEKLLPSYIGTSIENKPARLKRNEKFHAQIHKNLVPTIEQTIQMINSWLEYKNSRPCPNCKTKTVAQMLFGIEKQKINERILDDLMLAQEVKTITSQGIRFLKADYFSDELYGLRQKVVIKYSLFDLSYIKVYTLSGRFLCKAERSTLTHPLAHYTGEVKDMEDFKQKIQKQKQLKNRTIKAAKQFLDVEDLEILECEMVESQAVEDISKIEVAPSAPKKEKCTPIQKPQRNKIFKTNFERYDFLMKNGCTNNDERNWLRNYKMTKECKIYEENIL